MVEFFILGFDPVVVLLPTNPVQIGVNQKTFKHSSKPQIFKGA